MPNEESGDNFRFPVVQVIKKTLPGFIPTLANHAKYTELIINYNLCNFKGKCQTLLGTSFSIVNIYCFVLVRQNI